MNSDFLKQIKLRKEKLEEVKQKLKQKFIGIDDVIDKIIDTISLWYLTPEIQFKPLIVSLWGITGVGKTDLVRTLVRELKFTDKFIEIQMDVQNDYSKTVESYLENSSVDVTEPSILLLDEIQRYRTVDENGMMLENKYFNDVWMLLSDGKFQNNYQRKQEIMELLLSEMYWMDRNENEDDLEVEKTDNSGSKDSIEKPKKKPNYKFKTSYWTASRFKKMLNLDMTVEEIMKKSLEERLDMLENSLKLDNVNEGKSYEKLLIFISGNLDEAFRMANKVEDSESDADVYHELSKRINLIHIKNALRQKFKPEQIARFGNNHIIYPCLDKKSYYKIIRKNAAEILERIKNKHDIDISLSDEIYNVIYRNGVFPTQGVRPAISTVFNLLGSNLPHFIYHALLNKVNKFKIEYKDKVLSSDFGEMTITKKITLDIDNIRDDKSVDERMLVIVHEIGHALLYALLFKTPPQQININSTGLSEGFIISHTSVDNKTFLRDKIVVYLAGLVAEEQVFGEDFKSNGAQADIEQATNIAGSFVRSYGMGAYISKITAVLPTPNPNEVNYDIEKTNPIIEKILLEEKNRAKDLLNINLHAYKALIKHVVDNNGITIEDFIKICENNKIKLQPKEINEKLVYAYDEKLNHFLNQ